MANIVTVNQKRQPSEVVTYDETAHTMDVSYRFDIRPGDEVRINGKKGTFFKGSHSCNIKMKLLSFLVAPVIRSSNL